MGTVTVLGVNGLTNEQSIVAIYQALLGREPEAEGLAYWQGLLSMQADEDDLSPLVSAFFGSDEFQSRGLEDNADFINVLYDDLWQRSPVQDEVDYWLGVLSACNSREAVVEGFVESGEFLMLLGVAPDEPVV